jgi:hypothetical protein
MTSDEFREKLRNFLISLNDEINWDIINYQEEDDGAIATISIWEFEDEDHERESYSPNDYSDDAEALASAGFGTDEDYGGGDERL